MFVTLPMLTLHRHVLLLVLTSCLLVCGCRAAKDLGKTLGDLAVVRDELIKKFGDQDVNIRVNNFQNRTIIWVVYSNSPLNQKTTVERGQRAQETADIVRQHYPSIKNVSEMWVGFMRTTTRLAVFHSSEMIEAFGFDSEARALRDPREEYVDPSQPTVNYQERQNTTDVSGSIRLEGTEEKGVTVFPHFSLTGNLNKTKTKPPQEVSLDFAAFSDNPKFPDTTKIVFLVDDKEVYTTEGQFSTSRIAGGTYSELLYLKIPTAAFLKIASGNTLKIRLNDQEYTLTESKVLQIRRMSDYLR